MPPRPSSANGVVISPETGPSLIEQLDGLRSTVDRDSFDAIVGSRPDSAGRVLEQAANALLVKPCLLTDVHCRARGLPDDSPVVRADP